MQELVTFLLVDLHVAGRMKGDMGTVAPIGPDAQRDLLCHGSAWHEDGGLLTQNLGNLGLEVRDETPPAVHIGGHFLAHGRNHARQHVVRHHSIPMVAAKPARASTSDAIDFALVHHERSSTLNR